MVHLMLVPVHFPLADGSGATQLSFFPSPVREFAPFVIKDLATVAGQTFAAMPDVHHMPPHSLWSERGTTLREARSTT